MLEAAILVVFPFCMVFAAISDLLSMTIANRVSIILVVTFAVIAPFTGMDIASLGGHFLAGIAMLLITFGLFAAGAMGGGDAKLISATALWMGFGLPLVGYLVATAVLGGLLTLLILAFRSSALHVFTGHTRFLRNLSSSAAGVPYGIALGIGGLMVFPASPLMVWALDRLSAG